MTTLVLVQAGILVVLLMLSAFFSSSETALFSLDPYQVDRIGEKHPGAAKQIHQLLATPTKLLSVILIANTIINIGASILFYDLAAHFFPARAELISIVVMTLLLLVFGEFGPKRIAMLWPEKIARWYLTPLRAATWLLTPLRLGLEKMTSSFEHIFTPRGHLFTQDEFHTVADLGEESGVLDKDEHAMVRAIIHLEKMIAADIMIPRVDLQGYDLSEGPEGILAFTRSVKLRYLVLYEESLDDIKGFIDVRAFLLDPDHQVEAATIPPYFIPEVCTLDKLLTQFLAEQRRVAIVVDEYGGTAGLITQGDLLEEITGDMGDEHHGTLLWEELTPEAWLIDGNMSIEEVNKRLGLQLEADNSDRLAGWFTEKVEHLPQVNERVTGDGYKAMVRQMRRNRIEIILMEKTETGP